jgi:hypothetical protein
MSDYRNNPIVIRLEIIIDLLQKMNERDQWFKDQSIKAQDNAQGDANKLVDDVIQRTKEVMEQDRIEKARASAGGVMRQ